MYSLKEKETGGTTFSLILTKIKTMVFRFST